MMLQLPDCNQLRIDVQRKAVKRLRLTVYPDGRVRLSVPWHCPEAEWRRFLDERSEWLATQLLRFASTEKQSRPRLEYASGQYLQLWGEQRLLQRETPLSGRGPELFLDPDNRIVLRIPEHCTPEQCAGIFDTWYKHLVAQQARPLLDHWQPRLGVRITHCSVRKMSSRWGSCSTRSRRIRLNSELAKYPPQCLEYIIVHELAHLLEANHSPRFWDIVRQHLSNYTQAEDLLKGKNMD